MTFFGQYLEVIPNARLVWTNEEAAAGPITTLTFEENGSSKTRVVMHELQPSKEALDATLSSEFESGTRATHAQLDELLLALGS